MAIAVFSSVARPAIPPAGQLITSRSRATFEMNGSQCSVFSNEVSLGILAIHGLTVLPDGTPDAPAAVVRAFGGETITFPFVLRNTGNADDVFRLGIVFPPPSDFVLSGARLYLDVDGDSIVDMGETAVGEVGPLQPGEEAHLLLRAVLPLGLVGGETAHVGLTACSVADTSACDRDNVIRIVARTEAQVELTLEADESSVLPGDTIGYTVRFANTGEQPATAITITNYVDYGGACIGTDFADGLISSPAGQIQLFDSTCGCWVDAALPTAHVKGVSLHLDRLDPGEGGFLSFKVRVRNDQPEGFIRNTAQSSFTDSYLQPHQLVSNEVSVHVDRMSSVAIGPLGDPTAQTGSPADRVVVTLDGDSTLTLWHELLNRGNFPDSFRVALADSGLIPTPWRLSFVDSTGAPLLHASPSTAILGTVPRGRSAVVGLRLSSTPEGLRRFEGRELTFEIEASSLFFGQSSDRVEDVLVKTDVPLISIKQSVREPTALVGDVLSFIITVENLTAETTLDSVSVVESISPGLGFAGGSAEPAREGNALRWMLGTLAPGEKREIVFRARVKAGQESGRLVSAAWAYGTTDMGEGASDGPSVASVLIVEGIFTRRGIIFGGAFVDADRDGLWDDGEPGVAGVSVFIEDGTYAVTDSSGLYSIPGMVEGRHVVRVDGSSLPDSLVPGVATHFGLGGAGRSLVDLAPSGNRRVDFPLERLSRASRAGDSDADSADAAAVDRPGGTSGRPSAQSSSAADSAVARGRAVGADGGVTRAAAGDAAEGARTAATRTGYDAITIPSTQFGPGKSVIDGLPLEKIAALSLWMRGHPGWKIMVEGHTDSIPMRSEEYPSNLELSIARARSVYQVLRMNGIPEERMDYTGRGSRMPVASNATAVGRAMNRRVEIRVVPPEDYGDGDPGLSRTLEAAPDTTYSLADSAGVCSEIIKPEEGSIFFSRGEIDVEITSPLGSETELYVNNVPVGRERIGLKKIDITRGVFGSVFYGVKLAEGKNDILVVCREYGGKRSVCSRRVYLAGRPTLITPEHETVRVNADGKTSPELVFLVSDRNGLPVRDGIFVTVAGPRDLTQRLDANPQQAGIQVATSGGRVVLTLPPSREARRERFTVGLDDLTARCGVSYESPLREWFLSGYGEGSVGYGNRTGSGSTLRSLDANRDGAYADGKVAFYGQGEIGGATLLTCAVDTRPLRDDMLFRRIEPEKYYPIYGDASQLAFNTASRSGTYLRVDNRRYSAMLGDFKTDLAQTEFTMYHRSFNGVTGEARLPRGIVRAFMTRTDQATYQDEISADGTSGFYFLRHYPLVEGSEKIRIEVRDRYRPENIVRVDYKQINRDYDINYMDGSILFKESIPVVDENLNPVTIVVGYECRDSGDRNLIYGMRSELAVRDSLAFGTTAVLEEEGAENSTLLGFDLTGELRSGLRLESEFAHSEKFLLGAGNAFRLTLKGEEANALRWGAYYRDVGDRFFNPSFSGGKTELGSKKYGADLDWRLNRGFGVAATGYRHAFRERDETLDFAALRCRYATGALEGSLGFGGAGRSDARDGEQRSLLMLTSVGYKGERTQGELQWDQILSGDEVQEYPNRLQATLARKLRKNLSATLKHEYRTGERSGTRHLTVLGVESSITESMTAYSRYQLDGAMSGERGQATMGIKNRFRLSDDFTATVAAERLATVSGARTDDYLSLSTGALYTPPRRDYRVKGDYEIRFEPDRRKHLLGLAALRRLDERWSFLLKGDLWFSDEKREADHVKGSSMLGVAMRPKTASALSLFALLKSGYEKNSPAHPEAVDRELVSSIEANYKPSEAWELEGKCAARWVRNSFRDYEAAASAVMYQAQVIRIIGARWDAGLKGRIVDQRETGTYSYGGGIELGRLVADNVWAGVGYDFGGHEDRDASINSFATNGFHVGVRLAFDEKIMNYFHGATGDGE
jgi:uncharacterized repeat protein (TIGR01451 family)